MDAKLVDALVTIAIVGISRLLSRFEHKKTGKDIAEIRLELNGYLKKREEIAREEGRIEERNKLNK